MKKTITPIETLRNDVREILAIPGMSMNKLATEAGIEWGVLKRFTAQGSSAGISFSTAEKLWPFIYGDKRPRPDGEQEAA